MKPTPFPAPSALDTICRRGALALFAALVVALAAGLVACGSLDWRADGVHHAIEARFGHPWLDVLVLLASAALTLVGVRGWRCLCAVASASLENRAVWRCFFAVIGALGLCSGLHHAIGAQAARVLAELCCAAGFAMLFLALMAERVDSRFGSVVARAIGLALAAAATVWWAWGWLANGAGDARGLVFVGLLPMLLIPAGVTGLPVKSGGGPSALAMFGVLLCSRLAAVSVETWVPGPAALAAQASMLACCATGAAWFLYRLVSTIRPSQSASEASPKLRSTSLKTSG